MSQEAMIKLAEAWDRMDRAAQNVTTALPYQIGERVAELEAARLAMRKAVQSVQMQPAH